MLKKLWYYAKGYRKEVVFAIILTVAEVILQLIIPLVQADIIDYGILTGDREYIISSGVLMVGLGVGALVAGRAATVLAARESMGIGAELRNQQFRSIQEMSFSQIDFFKPSTLITRFTTDITRVQMALVMAVRMFIRAPIMAIVAIFLAATISIPLSTILIVASPVLIIGVGFLIYKVRPLFSQMQERVDDVNLIVQENLSGIRVVKSFAKEDEESIRFEESNANLRDATLKAFDYFVATMPFVQVITFLTTAAVLWFGGNMVGTGDLMIGELSTFLTYINQIMFSLIMMSVVVMNLSRAHTSLERIFEVIDSKNPIEQNLVVPGKEVKEGKIEFKDVYFKYFDASESYVLKDINLVIEPGENVGILGGTGSGKSSLVQLIPRLYDIDKGELLIDGDDIKTYPLYNLRGVISMVLQQNTLFAGTVRKNLQLGKEKASDEEIWEALEVADAAEFVKKLPGQLDYEVEQEGANFSGGQRQRLTIARAIITQPKVLILDDSTSAVDTATEKRIQEAMKSYLKDTTVITIAQRVSSILTADHIIVMDGGEIESQGKHQELMEKSKIYKMVADSQSREVKNG